MKIKLISCEVFYREMSYALANSPHVYDVEFLHFGLHDTPEKLREAIQDEINASENCGYDYIVLGYGLCSRGTAGINTGSIPLIIVRAHDCITHFLGSRERYSKEFSNNPGTYYYSPGWIERKDGEVKQGELQDVKARMHQERYLEYVEKYGEDNAHFLFEEEARWSENYSRAVFINMGVGDIEAYRKFTSGLAINRGWEYSELQGDFSLIADLINGNWESKDFLLVKPYETITESYNEEILTVTKK